MQWRYSDKTMFALSPSTTVSTAKTKIHWNLPPLSISCPSGMQGTSARKLKWGLRPKEQAESP